MANCHIWIDRVLCCHIWCVCIAKKNRHRWWILLLLFRIFFFSLSSCTFLFAFWGKKEQKLSNTGSAEVHEIVKVVWNHGDGSLYGNWEKILSLFYQNICVYECGIRAPFLRLSCFNLSKTKWNLAHVKKMTK